MFLNNPGILRWDPILLRSDQFLTVENEYVSTAPVLVMAKELNRLISACVDLKNTIKDKVYFPVPSYSIKSVAPFFGFNWKLKDVNTMESMVLYWDYLKNGDKTCLEKILTYNEDDCRAMWFVDKAVSEL